MMFFELNVLTLKHNVRLVGRGVVKSSSGESLPAGSGNSAHPYKIPQQPPSTITKYESDYPLRKTGKSTAVTSAVFCSPYSVVGDNGIWIRSVAGQRVFFFSFVFFFLSFRYALLSAFTFE